MGQLLRKAEIKRQAQMIALGNGKAWYECVARVLTRAEKAEVRAVWNAMTEGTREDAFFKWFAES
jgi:hypothetical protein